MTKQKAIRLSLTKTLALWVDSETVWLEHTGPMRKATNISETCDVKLFNLLREKYEDNSLRLP